MATTTLDITVYGGVPPQPIDVTLYQGDTMIFSHSFPGSYTIPFNDLPSGLYGLYINGRNPLNPDGTTNSDAATKFVLDENEITLLPGSDLNPALERGKHYLVEYHFSV